MRLIDADDFKKFLQVLCKAGAPYEGVVGLLDKQPTAFDTEKVVEQLEEVKGKACTGKECFSCVYNDICCEGEMSERVAIDKAIDIVKKGGVE